MVLDVRTKKYLKIFALFAFVLVLTGCANNLDAKGHLLPARAITEATKWSPSAGLFDFILVIPIAKGIILLNNLTGNVLWGVVGMNVLINLIILPIMIKSTVSMQKMQLIQPEMQKIQDRYKGKNDQQSQMRMSAEIQALYKKNNVSMFGGFATFLSLPIMIAMWQSVQRVKILYSAKAFGLSLGVTPMSQITKGLWGYAVIIAIMALTQFAAIEINNFMLKRNPNYKESSQQGSMKMMNYMMVIMIVYFGLVMPTAMSFYWITTNVITVIRTIFIQIKFIENAKEEKEKKDANVIR